MIARAEVGPTVVVCGVGAIVCCIPIGTVSETMRSLPIDPVGDMPPFVMGLSIIRGEPVPVIDLAKLLGDESRAPKRRLVVVKTASKRIALSVERVVGIRTLGAESLTELSPLVGGANAQFIGMIGALDAQLLVVLESSRIIPDSAVIDAPREGEAR